jgi:DNA ligase-1
MLADTIPKLEDGSPDFNSLRYPVIASPKLDGIRCMIVGGKALTRKWNLIPNLYVRQWLQENLPDGLDGELMVRNAQFNEVSSGIMKSSGEPDFFYAVFDYVSDGLDEPYKDRIQKLREKLMVPDKHIWIVPQVLIHNAKEMEDFEQKALKDGYEGAMVRDPNGPYKNGRSTVSQGYLLKIKRFEDAEAIVTGVVPLFHNANEAEKDAFGRTKRSHMMEGLEEQPLVGAVKVKDVKTGIEFEIGTGFDAAQREALWKDRDKIIGKMLTYKSQKIGTKEKPRFPVFKGWRDKRDIS